MAWQADAYSQVCASPKPLLLYKTVSIKQTALYCLCLYKH